MPMPHASDWAARCAADGEFQLAARYWDGGIILRVDDHEAALSLEQGAVREGRPASMDGVVEITAKAEDYARFTEAEPPRFYNDLLFNMTHAKGFTTKGDFLVQAQYYAAVMRALELLRPAAPLRPTMAQEPRGKGRIDRPVGRYVHLDLQGHDHRVYFEEAGEGIPLLLQHTAGCHGSQWRHLMECEAITDRFRLIAYDLPYHGKSLPPVDREWWTERYLLKGAFLRSIPLGLADALELDRPVFMGCSVGGLLALDLAAKHPDRFRSVISLEGALHVEGSIDELSTLWHPRVGSEYKARTMDGLMSPSSPKPYRRETTFVYAAGWPPVFQGDLYYYLDEFDLRDEAASIDTNGIGVHIFSGEYDHSATLEMSRAAHEAIPGSTLTEMMGVGHFPMSENPERFIEYLLPVLEKIADSDRRA